MNKEFEKVFWREKNHIIKILSAMLANPSVVKTDPTDKDIDELIVRADKIVKMVWNYGEMK